jgi:hypothetical protein
MQMLHARLLRRRRTTAHQEKGTPLHGRDNVKVGTENGRRVRPATPQRPSPGILALQAAGNAAVLRALQHDGHPWAQHQHTAGCGHTAAELDARPAPVQRSTVHDVLRTPGRPLDQADHGPGPDRSSGGGERGPARGTGAPKSARVQFEKESHALSPAARAEIDAFADRQKGAIARAILEGRQVPRFEVEGRGRRNPDAPNSRARQRGDAVNMALEDRLREGDVLPANVVSDVVPNSVKTSSGPPGSSRSEQRVTTIWEVAPPPPRVVVGGGGPDALPVPRELHLAWFGGQMPPDGADNLAAWVQSAKDAGWHVNLYTDESAVAANRDLFDRLGRETGADGEQVVRTSADPATDLNIDRGSGAGELLTLAEERGIHTMKSDIVRYQALHQHGGVYVDSDIAPGGIDLSGQPPAMDRDTVPLLGPGFRDQASVDRTKAELAELQGVAGVPDSEMPSPAEFGWRLGSFNNNLIVAPAESGFIGKALNGLTVSEGLKEQIRLSDRKNPAAEVVKAAEDRARRDLGLGDTPISELSQEQRDQFDSARQEHLDRSQSAAEDRVKKSAAQITGPLYLNKLIPEHVAGDGIRDTSGFRMGDWQVAPEAAEYFGSLEFVTSSSDIKFDDGEPDGGAGRSAGPSV